MKITVLGIALIAVAVIAAIMLVRRFGEGQAQPNPPTQ